MEDFYNLYEAFQNYYVGLQSIKGSYITLVPWRWGSNSVWFQTNFSLRWFHQADHKATGK